MGLIYCFTNKKTKQNYVGLTTNSLKQRTKKHLSQLNDNTYFHRAIKANGLNAFDCTILEDNIETIEKLKEREIYWIKEKSAYVDDGGYNLTRGGDAVPYGVRKLTDEQVLEIKELLKSSTLSEFEIGLKYNVTNYAISDINRGKSWYDFKIEYPIRKQQIIVTDEDTFQSAVELLSLHTFSSQWITNKLGLDSATLSYINTGTYKKFKYPEGIAFPIQPFKIVSNNRLITNEQILQLYKDYLTIDSITKKELSKKYGISESYVKALLINQNNNHCFEKLHFPLKSFKDLNLSLIEEKLSIIESYS